MRRRLSIQQYTYVCCCHGNIHAASWFELVCGAEEGELSVTADAQHSQQQQASSNSQQQYRRRRGRVRTSVGLSTRTSTFLSWCSSIPACHVFSDLQPGEQKNKLVRAFPRLRRLLARFCDHRRPTATEDVGENTHEGGERRRQAVPRQPSQ